MAYLGLALNPEIEGIDIPPRRKARLLSSTTVEEPRPLGLHLRRGASRRDEGRPGQRSDRTPVDER